MSWAAVAGQETAVAVLRSDLARGRLAAAYLLFGPDGVGKRLLALQFAKALNCDSHGDDACDQCPSCRKTEQRTHPDVHWLEPEDERPIIKIDPVRVLLPRLGLRPYEGRRQALLIIGAEQLTDEAANALLKSLEEPSRNTVFILTTGNRAACLPTIISRCRPVPCARLSAAFIAGRLTQQGLPAPAAEALARASDGSLGRALARHAAGWWQRRQELMEMITLAQWPALAKPGGGDEPRAWVQETLELLIWSYREGALAAAAADGAERAVALAALVDWLLTRLEDVNHYANPKLTWAVVVDQLQGFCHLPGTGSLFARVL